jgi:hypothetical protein
LDRFSRTLKERDLGSLVGQVESFARHQPGAFIGSAALLGFMAARFFKSSAERHAPVSSYTSPAPSSTPSHASGLTHAATPAPSPSSAASTPVSPSSSPAPSASSGHGTTAPPVTDRPSSQTTARSGAANPSPNTPKGDK